MGKQNTATASWRQLATPIEAPKPVQESLFKAGHNCVVDRTADGALSIHIATDEAALASLYKTAPSADALKKNPKASGSTFLAMTAGMYGSVPVEIDGRRWYLKVSLKADKGSAEE